MHPSVPPPQGFPDHHVLAGVGAGRRTQASSVPTRYRQVREEGEVREWGGVGEAAVGSCEGTESEKGEIEVAGGHRCGKESMAAPR